MTAEKKTKRRKLMNVRMYVLGAFVVGVSGGLVTAVIASPPTPPWANADGTTNMERLPDHVDLLDCQGNVVGRRANPFADNAPAWLAPGASARNGHASCAVNGGATIEGYPVEQVSETP